MYILYMHMCVYVRDATQRSAAQRSETAEPIKLHIRTLALSQAREGGRRREGEREGGERGRGEREEREGERERKGEREMAGRKEKQKKLEKTKQKNKKPPHMYVYT